MWPMMCACIFIAKIGATVPELVFLFNEIEVHRFGDRLWLKEVDNVGTYCIHSS